MQIGAWLPSTEFDVDAQRLVRFAQDMEQAGVAFLESSDHVLTARLPESHGSATMIAQGYHDPFMLFGFLSQQTTLDFATSVLVLPQRPAALVAKQMAELIWFHGDRFRFGVGSGWNEPEFEALGVDFADRGAILSEQIAVIEALWPGGYASFEGQHHRLDQVGIAPATTRVGPPLWFGGHSRRVLERVARHGEGWMPLAPPTSPNLPAELELLRRLTDQRGRDPASIGIEGRIVLTISTTPDDWLRTAERWQRFGLTHLALTYEGGSYDDLDRVTETISGFVQRLTALFP